MWKFLKKYPPDGADGEVAQQYVRALDSFTRVASRYAPYAGHSFGGGIYRLYSVTELIEWTKAVEEVFTDYAGRIRCFGRDWLCNQFCLDLGREQQGEKLILLFEIATGKVLKIPETFEGFHESLLIDDAEAALAEQLFTRWRITDPKPLSGRESVGYKIPLFLGGKDDVQNLERTDSEVYWSLTGQMLMNTRDALTGTKIDSVKSE
jgi:hypothetical protein